MVHPYANQKLETFTSPIVHATMMYPIVLSVLRNTRPVAVTKDQEHPLLFPEIHVPPTDLLWFSRCGTASREELALLSE